VPPTLNSAATTARFDLERATVAGERDYLRSLNIDVVRTS